MEPTRIAVADSPSARNIAVRKEGDDRVNVSDPERLASAIGGGVLALYGLSRRGPGGLMLAVAGASLLYRGATGHCPVYDAAGVSSVDGVNRGEVGFKVDKSIIINRPPEELYRFWRDFVNLPRFMEHIQSVTPIDANRTHWVVKAPFGQTVEWDAEIINEKENELIAWKTLDGSTVESAGSVRFNRAPGGRGTELKVSLQYDPPAGAMGAVVAGLFGDNPQQSVEDDLRRFKQLMEAGEIATTVGQPKG